MPPTVDLGKKCDGRMELPGWCLVFRPLCIVWFLILSYLSYDLNVFAPLYKIGCWYYTMGISQQPVTYK